MVKWREEHPGYARQYYLNNKDKWEKGYNKQKKKGDEKVWIKYKSLPSY